MLIKGKKVTLRAIEEKDLALLQEWANDPEICQVIGGWHFPTSMQDQQKWFASLNVQSNNQRFIIENEKQVAIGTANLVSVNWKDRNAEHGMLLGSKETRGKGYGQDTIMAIMRYAFEELGLNRLDTTIISYNEPSLNVYLEKCGWKKEGTQRDWYFRKNKFWDRVVLGVTRADYNKLLAKNNYWS